MRRLLLSQWAGETLAYIGIYNHRLIAVIVVYAVIVVVAMIKQVSSHMRFNYPTTRFSTTTPN